MSCGDAQRCVCPTARSRAVLYGPHSKVEYLISGRAADGIKRQHLVNQESPRLGQPEASHARVLRVRLAMGPGVPDELAPEARVGRELLGVHPEGADEVDQVHLPVDRGL
ncbi:hypothetical protein EG864_14695, partial [Enterococcus faecalis]